MALEDIITYIGTVLAGLTGSGIVLSYEPVAIRPEDILSVFGGDQSINAWAITLEERDSTAETRLSNIEVLRRHKILIGLYQSVTNPAVSEPVCRQLSERAMTAFRPTVHRGAPQNIEYSEPLQRTEFSRVMVGSTLLCHYARHVWPIQELIRL